MIACATFHEESGNLYVNYQDKWTNGSAFSEHEGVVHVDLTLKFKTFVSVVDIFFLEIH